MSNPDEDRDDVYDLSGLKRLEERKGQRDLGVTGYRIFSGARDEGATSREAFLVTLAWYRAVVEAGNSTDEDKDDDSG